MVLIKVPVCHLLTFPILHPHSHRGSKVGGSSDIFSGEIAGIESVSVSIEVTELKSGEIWETSPVRNMLAGQGALIQESISSSFPSQFSGMSLFKGQISLFPSNSFPKIATWAWFFYLEYLARCSCVVVTCACWITSLWTRRGCSRRWEAVWWGGQSLASELGLSLNPNFATHNGMSWDEPLGVCTSTCSWGRCSLSVHRVPASITWTGAQEASGRVLKKGCYMKSEQAWWHSPKNTIAMSVWLLWAPEQSVSSWNPISGQSSAWAWHPLLFADRGPGVEVTLGL